MPASSQVIRKVLYMFAALLIAGCNQTCHPGNGHLSKKGGQNVINSTGKTQNPDKPLEAFLDSIGHLPTQPLANKAAFYADSVFKNQTQLDTIISTDDLSKLKNAVHKGAIALNTARRIFGAIEIDSICNDKDIQLASKTGFIPVVYYPFDKNRDTFNEFAICVGDPGHCPNAALYFFRGNRIIAKHAGYSHYGFDMNYFKDVDGKTVIYYVKEFADGSGEWWNNFFFYKYDGNKLIPVLNELENGNVTARDSRAFWLESTVEKTNPLTIRMVHYDQLPDTSSVDFGPKIIDDTTTVSYVWDEHSKTFSGQYEKSKITKPQILSYYLPGDDLLFINAYYKTLKSLMGEKAKRKRILDYLKKVKSYYAKK